MSVILQVDFPYQGPWGEEMTAAMNDLAESASRSEKINVLYHHCQLLGTR